MQKGVAREERRGAWLALAAAASLLLVAMTLAAIWFLSKRPTILDQVVVLTIPSGAEIFFDSRLVGTSPVKLEGVRAGYHSLVITKEGFEALSQSVAIYEPQTLEFKLRPLIPREVVGLSPAEQIEQCEQLAKQAFSRGRYIIPYEGSALYFADVVLSLDESNKFAVGMRESVRKALHQQAQSALSRGDVGRAREIYSALMEFFPKDEKARAAAIKLEDHLLHSRNDLNRLLRKAEAALKEGKLIEPPGQSAYYYSKQALAIDPGNARASQIRNQIKSKIAELIERLIAARDLKSAIEQLELAVKLFPEESFLRAELNQLKPKAAYAGAITISVRHLHDAAGESYCGGTLSLGSGQIRYDGSEHSFSVGAAQSKALFAGDKLTLQFQGVAHNFVASRPDAELFISALGQNQDARN
jgi:hypothetical protein